MASEAAGWNTNTYIFGVPNRNQESVSRNHCSQSQRNQQDNRVWFTVNRRQQRESLFSSLWETKDIAKPTYFPLRFWGAQGDDGTGDLSYRTYYLPRVSVSDSRIGT